MQSDYSDLLSASHLISREELCTVCISQFLLPSFIATTTAQATALQGVLQKLQIFQKKRW
jgi:hypothetical protein